jgi:hypothetical protein
MDIDFLKKNSVIYVFLSPPESVIKEKLFDLEKHGKYYIAEIKLNELLKIGENGKLKPCECVSQSVPNENLPSVNAMYTRLSEKYETQRYSHTTNVFTNLYVDKEMNKSLGDIRKEKIKKNLGPSLYDKIENREIEKLKNKLASMLSYNDNPLSIIKEASEEFEKTKLKFYQSRVDQLEERIYGTKKYKESSGVDSWQNWIHENIWIFGIRRDRVLNQAEGFATKPDFIFLTPDGFLDVLEIKLPTVDALTYDKSHDLYKISGTASSAIGQIAKYRRDFEDNSQTWKRKIKEENDIDIRTLRPRGFVLIGNSKDWPENKTEYLRIANNILHDVQIITYSDLFVMAKNFTHIYSEAV